MGELIDGLAQHMGLIREHNYHISPLDFVGKIFKFILMNWKFCIWIPISLKSDLKGPIDNKSALVQVMARRRTDDKPLPEPMLTQFTKEYLRY